MFASLLRSRAHCVVLAVFALGQTLLTLVHLPSLPCPLLRTTGVPCPGCGVSRSMAMLMRGNFGEAVRYHAFGPVFAGAGVVFIVASLLSDERRLKLAIMAEGMERRTRITPILLVMFFGYWGFRLLFMGMGYRGLMAN
jgi:hypothetical protein